jgi:hypothetical protein
MRWIVLCLWLCIGVPSGAAAGENYCHDEAVNAEWDELLADTPRDAIVIRLYALRQGLCGMIDRGQVGLDQATRIFELEHMKGVRERATEAVTKGRELRL